MDDKPEEGGRDGDSYGSHGDANGVEQEDLPVVFQLSWLSAWLLQAPSLAWVIEGKRSLCCWRGRLVSIAKCNQAAEPPETIFCSDQ